jgi:uncharacterized protein
MKRYRTRGALLLGALVLLCASAHATDFLALVRVGSLQEVQQALRAGADVKARDADGMTALLWACSIDGRGEEVVSALLKAGAGVNDKSKTDLTPLMAAALKERNLGIVGLLLGAGADCSARGAGGMTALMLASASNPTAEVTAALLKAGADAKARDSGNKTALTYAAYGNLNPEVASLLLKAGADVNAVDNDGWTPLLMAAQNNPNAKVVTVLLQAGAGVGAKNKAGITALFCAAAAGKNAETVSALLKAGADANAPNGEGWTPLMAAAQNKDALGVVSALLAGGANVNAKSPNGVTALILAANGTTNPDVVTALVQAGADISVRTGSGQAAFDLALKNASLKGTTALEKLRLAPDLFTMVKTGTPAVIQQAIRAGSDVNARNEDGATPLMIAAGCNPDPLVVSALLSAGAAIDATEGHYDMFAYRIRQGLKDFPGFRGSSDDAAKIEWALHEAVKSNSPKDQMNLLVVLKENGLKFEEVYFYLNDQDEPFPGPGSLLFHATLYPSAAKNFLTYLRGCERRNGKPYVEPILNRLLPGWIGERMAGAQTLMDYLASRLDNEENSEGLSKIFRDMMDLYRSYGAKHAGELSPVGQKAAKAESFAAYRAGLTPLMCASVNNPNPDVVRALVKAGTNPRQANVYGITPLLMAARLNASPAVISALIEAGADVNAADSDGYTPLMQAVSLGNRPDVVQVLLKSGANVRARNFFDNTPLSVAASSDQGTEAFTLLLGAGADVNARSRDGTTVLMKAAMYCRDVEVIRVLLRAGADPAARNSDASDAIDWAMGNPNPQVFQALPGAREAAVRRGRGGGTCLMDAARNNQNPEVIRALVRLGANVNAKADDGSTALMEAAFYNDNTGVTAELLRAGADAKAADTKQRTALFNALQRRGQDPRKVALLLGAGAAVNIRVAGITPLHYAAEYQSWEIIEMLLKAGADPKAQDGMGMTPSTYALTNPRLTGTDASDRLYRLTK